MTRRNECEVIPAAVAEWRRTRGLTQAGLAERAALSEALIAHVENGRRNVSLASLDKIAAALMVPPEALATINTRPEPEPEVA